MFLWLADTSILCLESTPQVEYWTGAASAEPRPWARNGWV